MTGRWVVSADPPRAIIDGLVEEWVVPTCQLLMQVVKSPHLNEHRTSRRAVVVVCREVEHKGASGDLEIDGSVVGVLPVDRAGE